MPCDIHLKMENGCVLPWDRSSEQSKRNSQDQHLSKYEERSRFHRLPSLNQLSNKHIKFLQSVTFGITTTCATLPCNQNQNMKDPNTFSDMSNMQVNSEARSLVQIHSIPVTLNAIPAYQTRIYHLDILWPCMESSTKLSFQVFLPIEGIPKKIYRCMTNRHEPWEPTHEKSL